MEGTKGARLVVPALPRLFCPLLSLKQRLKDVTQCMMHNPVPKGSGANQSLLGFADKKAVIATGPVSLCLEFLL